MRRFLGKNAEFSLKNQECFLHVLLQKKYVTLQPFPTCSNRKLKNTRIKEAGALTDYIPRVTGELPIFNIVKMLNSPPFPGVGGGGVFPLTSALRWYHIKSFRIRKNIRSLVFQVYSIYCTAFHNDCQYAKHNTVILPILFCDFLTDFDS